MSFVEKEYTFEGIKASFEILLENLERDFSKIKNDYNIRKSKMWKIKKDLDNFDNLDEKTKYYVLDIVFKYLPINQLFIKNIAYDKHELYKTIGGSYCLELDNKAEYNRFLFEFTTALSFALGYKKSEKINMIGQSDVIINDEMVIECKYINSHNKIQTRVSECIKQIITRVTNEEAKFGFIALNVSELIDSNDIQIFVDFVLLRYLEKYKRIYTDYNPEQLLKTISADNNFQKIITSYVMNDAETVVYSKLRPPIRMPENIKGMIFQAQLQIILACEDERLPIPIRGKTYHLNHDLPEDKYHEFSVMIHKLAVGI